MDSGNCFYDRKVHTEKILENGNWTSFSAIHFFHSSLYDAVMEGSKRGKFSIKLENIF